MCQSVLIRNDLRFRADWNYHQSSLITSLPLRWGLCLQVFLPKQINIRTSFHFSSPNCHFDLHQSAADFPMKVEIGFLHETQSGLQPSMISSSEKSLNIKVEIPFWDGKKPADDGTVSTSSVSEAFLKPMSSTFVKPSTELQQTSRDCCVQMTKNTTSLSPGNWKLLRVALPCDIRNEVPNAMGSNSKDSARQESWADSGTSHVSLKYLYTSQTPPKTAQVVALSFSHCRAICFCISRNKAELKSWAWKVLLTWSCLVVRNNHLNKIKRMRNVESSISILNSFENQYLHDERRFEVIRDKLAVIPLKNCSQIYSLGVQRLEEKAVLINLPWA